MTLRLHTLQSLQGELPHKLLQNVQISGSFDCPWQSNQVKHGVFKFIVVMPLKQS